MIVTAFKRSGEFDLNSVPSPETLYPWYPHKDSIKSVSFTNNVTFIGHRAFSLGAKEIGSDVLFGCMETTELKLVEDVDIVESDLVDD